MPVLYSSTEPERPRHRREVHPTHWLISTQVHMALSQSCNRFFHEDDFEYAVLKEGRCPYSRAKEVGDFGTV